ncbi:MAG: hypothetical protein IJW00_06305 [Clostridia bacterium]|nr:hypothetical protein [Clostridia bacterium]
MHTYDPARLADFDYDAALAELEEKIRRKKKAKNLLAHFEAEATRLTSVMEDRKAEYEVEQEEADALQSGSLTLLLYTLLGMKEDKINKEEAEALAAKAAYETAKAELDHVLNRQVELRAEIRSLGNCERDYDEMVAKKKAWLMAKEVTVNAEVEALEAEKAAIMRDTKELKEAMESGQYALRVAKSVMDALTQAQYLSIMDTQAPRSSRYGTISAAIRDTEIDHEKRNTLIRLDNSIQTLGKYLQDFAAELKDLASLSADDAPTTRLGGGLIFADRWLDGLISELMVDSKLCKIEEQMSPLLEKLTPIVKGLEQEYGEKEAACAKIDEKIRQIVLKRA